MDERTQRRMERRRVALAKRVEHCKHCQLGKVCKNRLLCLIDLPVVRQVDSRTCNVNCPRRVSRNEGVVSIPSVE